VAIAVVFVAAIVIGVWVLFRAFSSGMLGRASGEVVTVPDLVGLTEDQARSEVGARQLLLSVAQNAPNDEQPQGHIFKQDPEAGQRTRPRSKVTVFISLGPASYTVPKLVGEHLNNVPAILARARLRLGQVTKVYREGEPAGRVINQRPPAGTVLADTTMVEVTVADSSNLPTMIMPDLAGRPLSGAERELAQNNLHLSKVTYVGTDAQPVGTVISQSVAANAEVALGTKVELEVAMSITTKAQHARRLALRIPVPPGPERQRVKIKVFDGLGSRVVYDEQLSPGVVVDQRIDVEGPARVLVFIDDMNQPFREDDL